MEQINLGREYFMEKFGVMPKTAVNFDSFGHTRGLVQILKNEGYEGYICWRPFKFKGDYLWEGFDGTRILAHSLVVSYGTLKGEALDKIKWYMENENPKIGICCWGVGNHGGGPSKKDLEDINAFIKGCDETKILHSSLDDYIEEVNGEEHEVLKESFISCMVGCYTTMVRIKQANRRLENKIALTEKIMNYVDMTTDGGFDALELKKAKKALAFCQFHDILPGTSIKPVEDDSLRTLSYGEEIVDKLYTKAFFKLCEGEKKANDGEIPIMVFNPHPYEIEGEFEIGFMLANQNWNEDEQTFAEVFDENGNAVLTQNEKPECTFNLDWIQKVSFYAKIAPSSVTRFDARLTTLKKDTIKKPVYEDEKYFSVENDRMKVRISRDTGLIDLYEVDSKVYIENSGKIEVYNDNEDPWGMRVDSFCDYAGYFELMSDDEANDFIGYADEKVRNVRVVEDGKVRMKIQAFFTYKRSSCIVEYTIPKHGTYIDVDVMMYSSEPNKMIKYRLDTKLSGIPYGETAFGYQELYSDEKESVFHKWCGIVEDEKRLYVVNKGIYGGSFTENTIKLSLLRTPIYSAHPIEDRQIAPHVRFIKHIDMGERNFSFRITTDSDVARIAQIYNEEPQLLSFFPSGEGEKKTSRIVIDNPDIILSSVKKRDDKYVLTLYNSTEKVNDATILMPLADKELKLNFKKQELKTIEI
ncbi:MAG: alpha-mannosidase [Clostridia bacterium]|nr:alpha-mannosidase [Clostridia bacterium]